MHASKVAMINASRSMQIFGSHAYLKSYKIERLLRDALVTEIYEGTSEVHRMIIAGDILRSYHVDKMQYEDLN